jgi:hypothetical protein
VTLALQIILALSTLAQIPVPKQAIPPPSVEVKSAPSTPAVCFVGNKDSKVFHTRTCKAGAKVKIENKVVFASKDEALKAGYTPCKVCKP